MAKLRYYGFRLDDEQIKLLLALTKEEGFDKPSDYVRSKLFANAPKKLLEPCDDFRNLRTHRRSISIKDEDWDKLKSQLKGSRSVSSFVREIIHERINR